MAYKYWNRCKNGKDTTLFGKPSVSNLRENDTHQILN